LFTNFWANFCQLLLTLGRNYETGPNIESSGPEFGHLAAVIYPSAANCSAIANFPSNVSVHDAPVASAVADDSAVDDDIAAVSGLYFPAKYTITSTYNYFSKFI
jgi:hypothetical protein